MPVVSSQKQHMFHESKHRSGGAKTPFVKAVRSQSRKTTKRVKRGGK
jgi:hypothetical protein